MSQIPVAKPVLDEQEVEAVRRVILSGWVTRARRQGLGVCIAATAWGAAIVGFGLSPSLWLALIFVRLVILYYIYPYVF